MVKEITVQDMLDINNKRMAIKTAKRLGFRFQADIQ
jgi:DNA-binding winged helix-turn-helix (wHTH) protein